MNCMSTESISRISLRSGQTYALEEAERMILAGECGTFSPKIIDCFEAAKLELFQLTEGKFVLLDTE